MSKFIALLISCVYLLADILFFGSQHLFELVFTCAVGVGFISLPEIFGAGGGMVVKRGILNETPSWMVKICGWIILSMPFALYMASLLNN